MDEKIMAKIQKLIKELDILFDEYFLLGKNEEILKKINIKKGELYRINK